MICGKCGKDLICIKTGALIRTKKGIVHYADHHVCTCCIISIYTLSAPLRPDQYEGGFDIDFK